LPRLCGIVEMLWAWLAWDIKDLWCSSIKGGVFSLTGDQEVWTRKAADITQWLFSLPPNPWRVLMAFYMGIL